MFTGEIAKLSTHTVN